ncbi:MAG: amino-acid N-acetyltransferase [Halothiobacillaceae bacterium]|nr:amino-acid N-acetyltransferase [Halothiobacillaceae bacterium]
MNSDATASQAFVRGLRDAVPYVREHHDRVFVVSFGGEAIEHPSFAGVAEDLVHLANLGARLVLVPGARPQIDRRLAAAGIEPRYHKGLRVTEPEALSAVKEAIGQVMLDLMAALSARHGMTSGSGLSHRVLSGNFILARPMGVIDGVDFGYTGRLRRVDVAGLKDAVEDGSLVVQPSLGFSPTGEIFNLRAEEVAVATAVALGADKLIFLTDPIEGLPAEMTPTDAGRMRHDVALSEEFRLHLDSAVEACARGVSRVHLVDRETPGSLLLELFTRDGSGTLITAEPYERTRTAQMEDIGGIVALITPLEEEGVLVRRSREQLELEIDRFVVIERDGDVIGCAALYPYPENAMGELACLVIHPDYQRAGRAQRLLTHMEHLARRLGLARLFVLTTQTAQWFQERGFALAELSKLPLPRQQLYNFSRNSKIFIKPLA